MMARYAEERGMPRSPACAKSSISLRFDGKTLYAFGTKASLVFPAASGKPDARGHFDYSIERQRIPFHGPIPAGQYWIQPSQLWENNWRRYAFLNWS